LFPYERERNAKADSRPDEGLFGLSEYVPVTHQYQRSVIKEIFGVDIHSLCDHLLAYFQVPPSASLAQSAKVLAIIERVVLPENTILDQSPFFMQTSGGQQRNTRRLLRYFYLISSWSFLRTSALDILVV
jgi:hypothetical protein